MPFSNLILLIITLVVIGASYILEAANYITDKTSNIISGVAIIIYVAARIIQHTYVVKKHDDDEE